MKRPRQESAAELQRQVDKFNALCPVGSDVSVRKDNGEAILTKTTSAAYVLSGHTAVVMLADISGCYLLSRVSPIKGAKNAG